SRHDDLRLNRNVALERENVMSGHIATLGDPLLLSCPNIWKKGTKLRLPRIEALRHERRQNSVQLPTDQPVNHGLSKDRFDPARSSVSSQAVKFRMLGSEAASEPLSVRDS